MARLEEGLRRLWDAGIVGMVTGTVDGRLFDMNPAGLAMLGYSAEDIRDGLMWPQMHPPDRAELIASKLGVLATDGRCEPFESELLHKDGRRIPALLGGASLETGEQVEVIAFMVDLTQRKLLEAQLQQAQRLEAVGLLAGGVAHDLNNVLSAILMSAECVADELPAEHPSREDLAEIRNVALSASGIVRQLLAFSRQQVLQPRVLELGGVAAGLESMLRNPSTNGVGGPVEASG